MDKVPRDKLPLIQASKYTQWGIYQVVIKAFCPYRGIKITTTLLDKKKFITDMQFQKYVSLVGIDNDGKNYNITILNRDVNNSNEIVTKSKKMEMFIKNINDVKNKTVIIISPSKVDAHVQTYMLKEYSKGYDINVHHYDTFKIVIPKAPYSPLELKVLNADETKELQTIFKHLSNRKPGDKKMGEIGINDPQLAWLGGASVGSIIESTTYSPEAGYYVQYSTVVDK